MVLAVTLIGSVPLSWGCQFGPSITDLCTTSGLTDDFQPVDTANSFYIDSPQVCCSARLNGAHKNTAVTCKWVFVEGNMSSLDNPVIQDDTIYSNTDCYAGFTLTPPIRGFSDGEYKAVLHIDGEAKASTVFYIRKEQAGALPQIGTFELNPESISAGQQSELSWKVTGATYITLKPEPGKVDAEGKVKVSPDTDTSYTLYAVNRTGSSSKKINIKVLPVITAKTDLEIIEFWNTGNILFYRIKNKGIISSCPCPAKLYKNGLEVAEDYISPLLPGEERVESFATYHFSPRFSSFEGSTLPEGETDAVTMRICLNDPLACEETSLDDNCMEHNFGPLLNLNLVRYAASAEWVNNDGPLTLPVNKDYKTGWVTFGTAYLETGTYPSALLIVPGTNSGNWVQGSMGIPEGYPVSLKPFTIPHKGKVSSKVGLTADAPDNASVKLALGVKQGNDIEFFDPIVVTGKTKLQDYEVDLSILAGRQVQFVFRIEAGETLQQGSVAWIDPVFYQER